MEEEEGEGRGRWKSKRKKTMFWDEGGQYPFVLVVFSRSNVDGNRSERTKSQQEMNYTRTNAIACTREYPGT